MIFIGSLPFFEKVFMKKDYSKEREEKQGILKTWPLYTAGIKVPCKASLFRDLSSSLGKVKPQNGGL